MLVEILSHREQYPSLKITSAEMPEELPDGSYPETEAFKKAVGDRFFEDEADACRGPGGGAAIKAFAEANTQWDVTSAALPNGTKIDFDIQTDVANAKDRNTWIVKHLKGDAASQPATAPGNP